VGEPVTRTVIVDAVGLEENMIAEPAWPELPDTRIYPDQPQGITRDDGEWVLGHKEFRYAVVPEREGELVLPELRVEWWDTQHNTARTAVLEAHTIFVQPSALVPPPPTTATVSRDGPEEFMPQAGPSEPAYWRWLALTFALLWVMTVLFSWQFVTRIQRKSNVSARSSRETQKETGLLSSLRAASLSGDRRAARRSLQSWLREFGPIENNRSLLEFAASLGDPDLSGSIYALDSEGFQPASQGEPQAAWDGGEFWRKFDNWRRGNQSSRKNGAPPRSDLYAPENRTAR